MDLTTLLGNGGDIQREGGSVFAKLTGYFSFQRKECLSSSRLSIPIQLMRFGNLKIFTYLYLKSSSNKAIMFSRPLRSLNGSIQQYVILDNLGC